uniref:Saposin B-type domain-containing protein n=1 Tax=Haemonchus contortus TaxID=6289 RepID=A0A7I4Z3H7_HAECO|nr:CBN-SPP-18 protein [Haemonchus contortus]
MMKIALLVATLCGIAFSMPRDIKLDGGIDECGAKDIKLIKFLKTGDDKFDIVCEMCLDMVLIAETYAECGEAEVEAALEKKCDKDFSSAATDKLCRSMVEKIAHEVIEDTEEDPSKVCYKVIHKECSYSMV